MSARAPKSPSPRLPSTFEPVAMHVVETPEQLKAFTDPLRNQVLAILAEREATNQQIADLLGQPQAKVLYHIRVLLQEDLIRLVDTQVKGGNVEKYYRAIARLFSLRPGPETFPALVNAGLEVVRQEVAGSTAAWPDQPRHYESRNRRIAPEQVTAFFKKLQALISQEWDGLEEDPDAPLTAFVALSYRDPTDVAGAAKKPAAVKPAPVKPAAAKAAGQKPAVRKAAKEQPKPRKRSTKKRDG